MSAHLAVRSSAEHREHDTVTSSCAGLQNVSEVLTIRAVGVFRIEWNVYDHRSLGPGCNRRLFTVRNSPACSVSVLACAMFQAVCSYARARPTPSKPSGSSSLPSTCGRSLLRFFGLSARCRSGPVINGPGYRRCKSAFGNAGDAAGAPGGSAVIAKQMNTVSTRTCWLAVSLAFGV